jgi:hypothetical protein
MSVRTTSTNPFYFYQIFPGPVNAREQSVPDKNFRKTSTKTAVSSEPLSKIPKRTENLKSAPSEFLFKLFPFFIYCINWRLVK